MTNIKFLEYDNDFELLKNFVSNLIVRKFLYWTKVTQNNVIQYLLNDLQPLSLKKSIIVYLDNNEIYSLLGYNILDWDTAHFGFKCANIDYFLINSNIDEKAKKIAIKELLFEYLITSNKSEIKFTSISVDSWDTQISLILQEFTFKYILTWINGFVNSDTKIPEINTEFEVGLIKPDELLLFQKMSEENYFKGGRFYLDSNFNVTSVKKLYNNIILSSYQNNDILFVCRKSDNPIGLFICKKIQQFTEFDNLKIAPLRYLIIDPNYRKTNVAKDFFLQTIRYLQKQSDIITTGLEVHNMPSLNLHHQVGFKFNYTHNVFHFWNNNF